MKSTYDKTVDAKYIKISKKPSRRGVVVRTEQLSDWLNVDYDKQGNIYGIEVLCASRHPVTVLIDEKGSIVIREGPARGALSNVKTSSFAIMR